LTGSSEHVPLVVVIELTRGWASLQLRALWEYRELPAGLFRSVWHIPGNAEQPVSPCQLVSGQG
jgi:hypothetical protein